MAKFKFSRPVSPPGIAKFIYDTKPQAPYKQGDKEYFKVRVLLDDTEENRGWCNKVIEQAKTEAKKAGVKVKKNCKTPFQFPEDQDEDDYVPEEGKDRPKLDEDHQGRIFFEAKSTFPPGRIDAKKNSLTDETRIMGGDIVRVKVQYNPYEGLGSGISFYFVTIQLIEKNTSFTGGGVDDDGFDEEDGFEESSEDNDYDDDDDEITF